MLACVDFESYYTAQVECSGVFDWLTNELLKQIKCYAGIFLKYQLGTRFINGLARLFINRVFFCKDFETLSPIKLS